MGLGRAPLLVTMISAVNSKHRFSIPCLPCRVPLRLVLVVPFVLQVTIAVGVTGWLSLRNGQQAILDLASQLSKQASNRVSQQLSNYLEQPRKANEVNFQAIQLGMLKPDDFKTTGRFFWKQMKLSQNLSYINFGSQQGTFIGVGREDDGSLYTEQMQPSDRFYYKRYALDDRGNLSRLLATKLYAFHEDAWYASAIIKGKPLWSPIYQWQDRPEIISISSSYPVFDASKQVVGVLGVDFILSQISHFLRDLQISPSGQVFIIERDGMVVASSSQEKPYLQVKGKATRLNILQSQEPLMRNVALELRDRIGTFSQIKTPQLLPLNLNGELAFVSVVPWQDAMGLDWLIVVVVPESDFMAQIHANTRTTILLCLLALAVAILLGSLTSRWLTQPIRQIAAASQAIAQGKLDQPIQVYGIDELALLSESFNHMATQLQLSFTELENRVAERTAELAQAKDAAEAAAHAKSEFLAQVSHELRTPLNAIIGFAQMMERDPALAQQHQNQVAIVHRNGKELLSLINDILQVSRLQTSEYQLHQLDQTLAVRSSTGLQTILPLIQTPLQHYLMQMPPEWIEQLYQAAMKGSDSDILQLIQEIPSVCAPLADILKIWIADFHFDHVIHLVHANKP